MQSPDPKKTTDTEEYNRLYNRAVRDCLMAGARGAVYGAVGSTAMVLGGSRFIPLLRNLTPQAKFATISMFTIGTAVIEGENTLYRFHRPYLVEEAYRAKVERSWADWAFDHRLPIVAGTFASTVALGALWMSKNAPYQTGTQKVLNLRLYGQAAGFAALFGTLAIGIVTAQGRRQQEKQAGEEYQEPKSQ